MNELRDKNVIRGILGEIEKKARVLLEPVKIMEVCGTHTMTIHKFGLRKLLEEAGVEKVRVRIEKPGAVRFAGSAGVEIERSRG